jgi:hypothetical protein
MNYFNNIYNWVSDPEDYVYVYIVTEDPKDNYKISETEKEDSCVSDIISHYKDNLDELDDDIFLNVVEELRSYNVDIKHFDDLLNKENLKEEEQVYVCYLITFINALIKDRLDDKITKLTELKKKF